MKENLNKPLYKDYVKQKGYRIWGTAESRGRSYEHADRPLILSGWMLILFAVGIIGYLNPYSRCYPFETVIICLILFYLSVSLYERKFLYRFGRFRVTWEDEELHPETLASSHCDKYGKFLKTKENRVFSRKSRLAIFTLLAGIIAAVFLYCFLWIGLSYTRVYTWYSGEIEEAWQIAQKYEYISAHDWWGISVGGETADGEDVSEQDRRRLWEIFSSLKWEYVSASYIRCSEGYIEIHIHTIFGYSNLLWYEDIVDTSSQIGHSFADTVIRLDEHWWYLRMNDGREFW